MVETLECSLRETSDNRNRPYQRAMAKHWPPSVLASPVREIRHSGLNPTGCVRNGSVNTGCDKCRNCARMRSGFVMQLLYPDGTPGAATL